LNTLTSPGKPTTKVSLLDILRVLKPLLFLIIPIVILIINHFFVAPKWPEIAIWVGYTAYILCGIIGLWVAIRLIIYLNSVLRVWRHEREVMRRDPLFVVETKMRARLREVHNKLRRQDLRPYDVPFYAVVGQKPGIVNTVLSGSGIAFPKDLNEKSQKDQTDGYEEWLIGNDAVFVDISGLQAPQKDPEWKIFLKTLSALRPSVPLNGVLIVLPAEHMRDKDARLRKEYEISIQKNLQLIQEKLQEKFPVYLVVSEVDRLTGFKEFFEDLKEDDRSQMLGWSAGNSVKDTVLLETLNADIVKIRSRMETLMLRKMAAQRNTQNVDLIYTFAAEFNSLLGGVTQFISKVFNPDAYLDPVSVRGFYFIGVNAGSVQSLGADIPLGRQTVIGDGKNMRGDASTMIGEGLSIQAVKNAQNWFSKDLFLKKMLQESGAVSRPRWVQKKQLIIKIVAVTTLLLQLLLMGGLLVSEAGKTSDWREESATIIRRASVLVVKKDPVTADELGARQVLEDILRIEDSMTKQGLFKSATSIGLGGEVADKLNNLHALVYQKYFLQPLITKVESEISKWDGAETEFAPIGRKLIEYIRWANPKYQGQLSIEPFVSTEKDAISTKNTRFLLRHFIQNTTDSVPRMTDNNAVARISRALETVNGASKITIPLESGPKNRLPGEREWEWWQRLSGSLSGFSDTTEALLKVESPFLDRQDKDVNDQIYAASKMVGQLMSGILEVENIVEEGKTKYPTWISSMDTFFLELRSAAVDWLPMTEVIDKSETRSEDAYDKIVVPLLNKEMAWVQTFIGLRDDRLTSFLDRVVKKKTSVGGREIDIYRQIGEKYLAFLKSYNGYLVGFGDLIKKSGALVSYSTYYSGDELLKKLEIVKKDLAALTELENKAVGSASVLDGILDEVEKKEADDPELKLKAGAKKNAMAMGKDALGDAVAGIEIKREVLTKFYWIDFSAWLKKWQPGLKVEKAYLASLYWMELFDWFKPFTGQQMKGGSYNSILRMNLFVQKNPQFFTEDIEKFLDGWLLSVPAEVVALLKDENAMQLNPGLRDFDILYSQVQKFKEQYLPLLRQAAAMFVAAVNLMDTDAQKTLKKLTDGTEPELNWDALESFTKFKKEYEIKEGIALRNITGSLEEIQMALSKTLNGELGKKFESGWNSVINKLKLKDTNKKFPFVADGPSSSKDEALQALSEFVTLGISVGVIKEEDGTSVELAGESEKLMDQIVPNVQRKFLEQCAVYKKFLSGEKEQMPEVAVELIPGDIGKHYHWVRMFVGRLRYFDLSVYGDKKITIDLASTVGGVKFMGLDVDKSSLAEETVTKGDLGLLQLTYMNGRPLDKERTKWKVTGTLASASADGAQVSFEMQFTFSSALPQLPILPE
jgi:hypothetical protein